VFEFILSMLAVIRVFLRTRRDTAIELLALRQQVAVLKRKRPRPQLSAWDRLFWTALRRIWPRWQEVLIIVKPETVIGWHRAGFRTYWRWRSRSRPGRPKITAEMRALIRKMAEENSGWGSPRIHGELQKLNFTVSERSVARYLRQIRKGGKPDHRWLTFLSNHREAVAAFDFFTVPTVTFQLLYCFFVVGHARRKILHFHITRHPDAEWVVQQLRETLPEAGPYRYAIFDRDAKFNGSVTTFLESTGIKPKQTSPQSPWQNGVAERWVGTCRREMLDHIIPVNEAHLHRLMREFVTHFNEERTHDSLAKDAPGKRPVEPRPSPDAEVIALPRLGGLHHRCTWRRAA
jgi:putative transposase